MGLLVGELVPGLAELPSSSFRPGQERVRLLGREVAGVAASAGWSCGSSFTRRRGRGGAEAAPSSAESASPIVRSWPWKARCQCSAGHLAACSSSGDQLLGRDEVLLGEDQHGLGVDPPGIRLGLLAAVFVAAFGRFALRPDGLAVLEHLRGDTSDPAEGLDAGDIEDDLVAGLELLRLIASPLLEADQVEAALDVDPEVLERAGQDPGLGRVIRHGAILLAP